jgi:hypothetical protein
VAPPPGNYNVVGTATGFNGSISCRVEVVSSFGSSFSATPIGHNSTSITAAETGAMSVTSRSTIEELCNGFNGTMVVHRALTAVQVTTTHGTINRGPIQHLGKVPARPMNRFVGRAGHAPVARKS